MMSKLVVVVAGWLVVGGSAAIVRGKSEPLAAESDLAVREKLNAALSSLFDQTAPTVQASQRGVKDTKQMPAPGLKIQVPEKELKSFMAKLSPGCQSQFSSIIQGNGPALHTFGHPGTDTSSAGCAKLDGSLCAMTAQVSKGHIQNGRTMSSDQRVEGNGCLPKHCMSSSDLQELVSWMHGKAKGVMPSQGIDIAVNVDCSKTGGAVAAIGKIEGKSSSENTQEDKITQKIDASKAEGVDASKAEGVDASKAEGEKPAIRGAAGKVRNGACGQMVSGAVLTALAVVAATGTFA